MSKSLFLNEKVNNVIKYILPSILTAILFCIVLSIKNIYPFGTDSIDYYDLSAQIVTYYIHIWDSLHGAKNIFYDVYSALSTNMTTTCGSSSFSVFNLFFLFIKRENILKSMSVFLLMKMMTMSFSMNFFLKKTIKAKNLVCCLFSVLYSFSGFVLMHYTIMEWMDIAALFPFVMLGLYELVKEGRCALYTVMLTISIVAGYYLSFMVIIYIFLMVGLVIFVEKMMAIINKTKSVEEYHLVKLLASTVASIAISSFILIPQIVQTSASARFTNESGNGLLEMYKGILSNVMPAYTSRWFVVVGVSLPLAIIVVGIIEFRKEYKLVFHTAGSIFIICAELLFENINLLWHYGSYVHYPIRNGFMITFTLSALACLYIGKISEQGNADEKQAHFINRILKIFAPIVSISALVVVLIFYKNHDALSVQQVFYILVAVMAFMTIIYWVLIVIQRDIDIKSVTIILASELLLYGYIFIGQPTYITGYAEEPEMERDSYYICNELYDELGFSDDIQQSVNRIKNPDTSLNSNYPLVLRRSALSNWTALIDPSTQRGAAKYGYSIQYTRLLDSGGTVFTDALLGVKNIVSKDEQNDSLYSLRNKVEVTIDQETNKLGNYYYYDSNYVLPFGTLIKDMSLLEKDYSGVEGFYNNIYHAIEGADDNCNIAQSEAEFDFGNSSDFADKSENCLLDIKGKKALYYFANQIDTEDCNTRIIVNGNAIKVPTIGDTENELYPAHFNNNALYLGVFSDENADINVSVSSIDRNGNNIDKNLRGCIISIDLEVLEDLSDYYKNSSWDIIVGKTGYHLSVDNKQDSEFIMIPISCDKGYSVYINNKKTESKPIDGLFIAVPLNSGINEIKISYIPYGLVQGIVISVIALFCYLMFLYFAKIRKWKDFKWIGLAYAIGWLVVFSVMYIIPIGYSFISILSNL